MSSWVESHYPVAASRAEDDQDRETADAAHGTAPSAPAAAADELESRARAGEPCRQFDAADAATWTGACVVRR